MHKAEADANLNAACSDCRVSLQVSSSLCFIIFGLFRLANAFVHSVYKQLAAAVLLLSVIAGRCEVLMVGR